MKILNPFRIGLFGGLGVLTAVAIGAAVTSLGTILAYVGAALFLALGIDPIVTALEKRRWPRWTAILTVLIGIVAVFVAIAFAVVPVITDQVNLLIAQIPTFVTYFIDGTAYTWATETFPWLDVDQVRDDALSFAQNPDNITGIFGGVLQTTFAIASGAFGGLIVLILTLYFTASLAEVKRALYQVVPASRRQRFVDIAEQISESVGRYVIGQVSLASVNGVLSFVYLTFIVRVDYSALLALIAFLFSLVPLVGTISGSVTITLLTLLFTGVHWPAVIAVGIYYLVYMQVEAYLLSPNIMNRAVKVPGVIVVIAALVGGTLLGVLGALVAIPVAASLLIIYRQVIVPRQSEL